MEEEKKKKLTKDEMITELMGMLKENNMKDEANALHELCSYVDSMEKRLESMTDELKGMNEQIKAIKEDKFLNNLRKHMESSAEKLSESCKELKADLGIAKKEIKEGAARIAADAKKNGRAALNKVSEILNVKGILEGMKKRIENDIRDTAQTVSRLQTFGEGMRAAGQKIANSFRQLAGKPEIDYGSIQRKVTKTQLLKKPWENHLKHLQNMEKKVDGALRSVNDLATKVKIDRLQDTFRKIMDEQNRENREQPDPISVVAEKGKEYGADMFEKHMKSQGDKGVKDVVKPEIKKPKKR